MLLRGLVLPSWNFGTKVEIQNPLSSAAHELNRKKELFLFDFFIACNFTQIHFLLLSSLYKNKLASVRYA